MKLPAFWIDAFSEGPFTGNPAVVCVVDDWPRDDLMQSIAAEHNLSETAFIRPETGGWSIRWMTPVTEVDLCGHATLASAYVVNRFFEPESAEVTFASRSGPLVARLCGQDIVLDLPARRPRPQNTRGALAAALGTEPVSEWRADYYLAELKSEQALVALAPDMDRISGLGGTGVIVTAPGSSTDFVSRFFAPAVGVPEDPVTGSAHCTLVPFWSRRLGKTRLTARQLSKRGGSLRCEDRGERVDVGGQAVLYMRGTIECPGIRS
jgi:PhzF family phenazine biosynthesis protein